MHCLLQRALSLVHQLVPLLGVLSITLLIGKRKIFVLVLEEIPHLS